MVGMSIEVAGISAAIGDGCTLHRDGEPILAELVSLRDDRSTCLALGETTGLKSGALVEELGRPLPVRVGPQLLGRVLDGLGRPIDDGPPLVGLEEVGIDGTPPHPLRRGLVDEQLALGVRVLDGLLPCGKGQRIGIFAGSGVGKSTLLSMIARGTLGRRRRGRPRRRARPGGRASSSSATSGPRACARAVVVVATSDEPALVRIHAAFARDTHRRVVPRPAAPTCC